ncbi:MAG TPA: hypothetical protein GXX36_03360 [Clostridiaceae bacterium]|nr:hypothetical protein [Clostridiaceae bacterium]
MALKGVVGAVYENESAPIYENVALLFDWTLSVEYKKEYTYGPELHAIPIGWHVKARAYWTVKNISKGQFFFRLFIGKGNDKRCLAGQVEMPVLKKTKDINESEILLEGISQIKQEG